jgi:septum formation protein
VIVLASASPRRRELLSAAGLEFVVEPAGVDEELTQGSDPRAAARALALHKARAVAGRHVERRIVTWVIGADTIVALRRRAGWRLLGKPSDEDDAREMLRELSGVRHLVTTGVAVVRTGDRAGGSWERDRAGATWVTLRPLGAAEIEAYVATGEWRDKAGGYAIQESAERFVTHLEGDGLDNVVGLPVALTLELLREGGASLPA